MLNQVVGWVTIEKNKYLIELKLKSRRMNLKIEKLCREEDRRNVK